MMCSPASSDELSLAVLAERYSSCHRQLLSSMTQQIVGKELMGVNNFQEAIRPCARPGQVDLFMLLLAC